MNNRSTSPAVRQEVKRVTINYELKKDLQDNEIICPCCHGTGLDVADNVYGIRGDTTHIGVHFPYKQQSISFCKHCYKGVLTLCPGCGKPYSRSQYECPCGYESNKRRLDWALRDWGTWKASEKISQTEAFKRFKCLYVDNLDRYVFNEGDLECAIDDYMNGADEDTNIRDLRVYGTKMTSIFIDAQRVAENACEDLHEDSLNNCDVSGLQKLLDAWCEAQDGTETYYPDYSIGVLVGDLNP